jgi:hypothetical protein
VSRQVLVTFFVTVILWDVMKIFTTNSNCSLHLCRHDRSRQDSSTDADSSRRERALFVYVSTLNSLLGGLEAKTDIAVPAFWSTLLFGSKLRILENTSLELESFFGLIITFSYHDIFELYIGIVVIIQDLRDVVSFSR